MMMNNSFQLAAFAAMACFSLPAFAAEKINYVEPAKPYDNSPALKTRKGDIDLSRPLQIPLIAWSADGLLIDLNGGLDAKQGTDLAKSLGRPVQLKLQNIVDDQVADYVSGKSPFFRGTSGQIALIAAALSKLDPGLEPITFIQLSRSTGADAFVSKPINDLADLKGKTVITQLYGPHPELIANILRDGGLKPTDVTLKYVKNITDPTWAAGKPIEDPANAFRNDPSATGVTTIDIDAMGLTGGKVGTGADGTVATAKTTFSTKTAANIIFDCIAVRKDFLIANPGIVEALRKTHIAAQDAWIESFNGLKNKPRAEKQKLLDRTRPMAKIILDDAALAGDFLLWLSEGSQLAGTNGNKDFFRESNPNGFKESTSRVQDFYRDLGMISNTMNLVANKPFPDSAAPSVPTTPAKKAFASEQAVRAAADSKNSTVMYRYTFQFNPQESTVNWQDYPVIFQKINETVTRYGGAIIQIRGHGDNFFYKFVTAKRSKGETTYQKKDKVTGEYSPPISLPDPVQILNDSNALSYTRAFNVKAAYANYARSLNQTSDTIDLSRFDVKGMGISQPAVENPKSADDRARNMRCEIVIIAAESELPSDLSADDLK
jgi:flagellar motor protein MotB